MLPRVNFFEHDGSVLFPDFPSKNLKDFSSGLVGSPHGPKNSKLLEGEIVVLEEILHQLILLMAEILHHLGCMKPYK